ncbi:hypothetical protein CLV40_1493 [Actinokineospora auranticolor]|uniref:Uncharacterized protein n=1 Tax=Actinokineospora auranticolor TaxID=155976 RepID=A0A2S6GB29_9PSEU|nr:hypothetical protein CLV40_1493 [Actinokineospora auranticolor]
MESGGVFGDVGGVVVQQMCGVEERAGSLVEGEDLGACPFPLLLAEVCPGGEQVIEGGLEEAGGGGGVGFCRRCR